MGGRGASSGISIAGNKYGTQYKTLYQSGNIKFVTKTNKNSETLMETMTKGRIYVTINAIGDPKDITYFDANNKRIKTINLKHSHKDIIPHTHHGYVHNENDGKIGASHLTTEERTMVDRIINLWKNRNNK